MPGGNPRYTMNSATKGGKTPILTNETAASVVKDVAKGTPDGASQIASNPLMHFVLGLGLGGGLVAGMQARLWWLELLCLAGVLLYVLFRSGITKTMQKRNAR